MGVRTSSILVDGWADQVLDWFSDRFGLRRKRNQRLIHFGGKREKDRILARRLLPKPASAADFLPVHDGDDGSLVGGIHLEQRLAGQSLQRCAHGLARPMQLGGDLNLRGIELPGLESLVRLVRCMKHAVEPQCGVVGVAPYGKLLHASRKRDKSLIFPGDSNLLL